MGKQAMSPTEESTESPRKRQKALSCQRCRTRKQKCSDTRPCSNCISANKDCISAEPVARRSRVSAEYTRSLEQRIAELEAQLPQSSCISVPRGVQQEVARSSTPADDPTVINDVGRNFESNEPEAEQERTPIPEREIQRYSARTHESGDGRDPDTGSGAQHLDLPTCDSFAHVHLVSSCFSQGLLESQILDERCGHTSLLPNALTTLVGENLCRRSASRDRPLSLSRLKPGNLVRLPDGIVDTLVQIYLERVNPRYPFLHASTFLEWYKAWKARPKEHAEENQQDRWTDFFVIMVQAVSILLTPRVSPDDIATSQLLYNAAINYLHFVLSKTNPVLHVQAHLLLTLHALHSPSSLVIITMAAATMRQCVIGNLHLAEYEPKSSFPEFSEEVQIRRRVFWSAYAIDRLVSWIYHMPNNLVDEHITVELFSNVDDASLYQDTSNLTEPPTRDMLQRTRISPSLHLIRCRCIQSRILNTMLRSDFPQIDSSPAWREHMMKELELWRSQVERLSHRANRGYLSDRWVGMAYSYTIALLHQPTKENVCHGFGDRSLSACIKLALTFRSFQKDRQTAQLWPGLLSQFTVGVTILYCFWATPPAYRTSTYRGAEISEALRACSTALAILSERWVQAEPLRDVFDILATEIPTHDGPGVAVSSKHISSDASAQIGSYMPAVQEISRNRVVLRMLQEIMVDDFPSSPQDHSQHPASPSNNHSCSARCPLFYGTAAFDSMMHWDFDSQNLACGEASGSFVAFDNTDMSPSFFGPAEF